MILEFVVSLKCQTSTMTIPRVLNILCVT